MGSDTSKRIGKALLLALLLNGVMYITGNGKYEYKSLHPAVGIALSIFFSFLIFFGALNLLQTLKEWRKKRKQ